MKYVKSLIAGLFVGMAALCARADGDVPFYTEQVLVSGIALNAGTATNFANPTNFLLGAIADVRRQSKVSVSIITTNSKADAVNPNILYYQRSVAGSSNTFETTLYPIGWTTTATAINPGAPLVILTNIDTLGAGWINFVYLTNSSGSSTNIGFFRLSCGTKTLAP